MPILLFIRDSIFFLLYVWMWGIILWHLIPLIVFFFLALGELLVKVFRWIAEKLVLDIYK